ncbi:hypothetical protein [Kocuria massiliensis]|uniref:hypothetical protein n=1 Tax=Kocuria massiliensis TaxID=1926282 RepID=UPI000A1C917F|nr:hypothetical protein [Kocuria massiliensis]MCT1368361.1 hypothetical protein [Rothia sp. p3-SID1597]
MSDPIVAAAIAGIAAVIVRLFDLVPYIGKKQRLLADQLDLLERIEATDHLDLDTSEARERIQQDLDKFGSRGQFRTANDWLNMAALMFVLTATFGMMALTLSGDLGLQEVKKFLITLLASFSLLSLVAALLGVAVSVGMWVTQVVRTSLKQGRKFLN